MSGEPSRPSPFALTGWIAFVLLFVYTVLIGGGWGGIYFVALRGLSLLLIAVALVVWLVLALRRPEWRPRSAIWPAFAVPLVVMAVSTALSDRPRLGIEYVGWSVLMTALYLLLVRVLAMPTARARIGGLAAGLGLGVGFLYVGIVLAAWTEWWSLIQIVAPPPLRPAYAGLAYGNPSAVLTAQVLLASVAFAGLGTATRGRRIVLLVLAVLTGLVIVLSGSRAGWLAVAGAALLVGIAWLLVGEHLGQIGRALRDRRVRIGLVTTGVIALLAALVLAPGILFRGGGGDGGRLSYYAAAWRMFVEDPIAGKGPGTWAPLRAAYTHADEIDYYITHAHNVYLHTLAEMGLLGLLAGLIVVACLVWLMARAIRGPDQARRRWAWWGLFALIYMGFHNLLDYYANMPSVLVLLAVPVAYLDATSERTIPLPGMSERTRRALATAGAITLAATCLVSVVVLARAEMVALTHEEAVGHIEAGAWDLAAPLAASALEQDPEIPAYQVTRALVAAQQRDWATAETLFERAAEIDDLPQSWLGLALARQELGRPTLEVLPLLERAMRLGVQQSAVALAVGWLYDRAGRAEEADDAYAVALAREPSLAGDPSWRDDPALAARFPRLLEQAAELRGEGWELQLMAGDAARALELVGDDAWSRGIIRAWLGDDSALEELQAAARADPLNAGLLIWAARASAHNGDAEQAAAFRRLARFVAVGATIPGYDVRIADHPSVIDPAAGTLTINYGTYLYRRPTPPDLMADGLPRFVLDDPADGSPADIAVEDG